MQNQSLALLYVNVSGNAFTFNSKDVSSPGSIYYGNIKECICYKLPDFHNGFKVEIKQKSQSS